MRMADNLQVTLALTSRANTTTQMLRALPLPLAAHFTRTRTRAAGSSHRYRFRRTAMEPAGGAAAAAGGAEETNVTKMAETPAAAPSFTVTEAPNPECVVRPAPHSHTPCATSLRPPDPRAHARPGLAGINHLTGRITLFHNNAFSVVHLRSRPTPVAWAGRRHTPCALHYHPWGAAPRRTRVLASRVLAYPPTRVSKPTRPCVGDFICNTSGVPRPTGDGGKGRRLSRSGDRVASLIHSTNALRQLPLVIAFPRAASIPTQRTHKS